MVLLEEFFTIHDHLNVKDTQNVSRQQTAKFPNYNKNFLKCAATTHSRFASHTPLLHKSESTLMMFPYLHRLMSNGMWTWMIPGDSSSKPQMWSVLITDLFSNGRIKQHAKPQVGSVLYVPCFMYWSDVLFFKRLTKALGFMQVIWSYSDHRRVSTIHAAILRVVRTRMLIQL